MKNSLKEIADIRVGFQFRGKVEPDPAGTVRVIQIKDIDSSRRIRTEDLVSVKVDRQEANFLRQGDVLFLARGNRQYATLVAQPLERTIASGYFFILRAATNRVRPDYLAWCINQSEFQEAMRPWVRGTNTALVSKTDFRDLQIRVPPLAVQEKIVKLNELLERETRLLAELQEKRARLIHAVNQRAARGQYP
jgi:restriction endonuclease S subunit